jgi:hypothetical protein
MSLDRSPPAFPSVTVNPDDGKQNSPVMVRLAVVDGERYIELRSVGVDGVLGEGRLLPVNMALRVARAIDEVAIAEPPAS